MLLMSMRRLGCRDQCSELCVREPAAPAWPPAALHASQPCWHQHCWVFLGDTGPMGADVSIITCYLSQTSTWATDTVNLSTTDLIYCLLHSGNFAVIIPKTYSCISLLQMYLIILSVLNDNLNVCTCFTILLYVSIVKCKWNICTCQLYESAFL